MRFGRDVIDAGLCAEFLPQAQGNGRFREGDGDRAGGFVHVAKNARVGGAGNHAGGSRLMVNAGDETPLQSRVDAVRAKRAFFHHAAGGGSELPDSRTWAIAG